MSIEEILQIISENLGYILLGGFGLFFLIYFIFSFGGIRKQIFKWIRMFIFFAFIVIIGDKILSMLFDTDFTTLGLSVEMVGLPAQITGNTINEVIDSAITYYAGASDPTIIAVIDGLVGCLFKFILYTVVAFVLSIIWNIVFWFIWIIFFRYRKKRDENGERTIKPNKHRFVGALVGGLRGSFLYCLALVILLNGPLSLIPENFDASQIKINPDVTTVAENVNEAEKDQMIQQIFGIISSYKQTPYYKWAKDAKVNETVNGKIWSFEANNIKYDLLDEISGMSDVLVEGLNVYSTYSKDKTIDFNGVGNVLSGLGESNLVGQLLPSLTGFALSLPQVEAAVNNANLGLTVNDLKQLDLTSIGQDLNKLGQMMTNVEKFVNSIEYVSVEDGNVNESKSYEWIRLDKLDKTALNEIIATLSGIKTLDSISKIAVKYALNLDQIKVYINGLEETLGKTINLSDQIDWVGNIITAFLDFGFESVNYLQNRYTEVLDQLDLGEKGSGDFGKVGALITAIFSNNLINECFVGLMNNVIANNEQIAKYAELFNFTSINDKGWQNEFNVIIELIKEIKDAIDDKNINIQNEEDKIKLSDLITNFKNFDFTILANIKTSTILGSDLLSSAAIQLLSTIDDESNMLHSLANFVNIPAKYKDANASEWATYEIKDYICQGIKNETDDSLKYDPVVVGENSYKRYQVISIDTYNALSAEQKTYFKAHNKIVGGELYNIINTGLGTLQNILENSSLDINEVLETKKINNYDFVKYISVDTLLGSEIACSSIAKLFATIDEETNPLHSLAQYIYVPEDLKTNYESNAWYKNTNGVVSGELANMLHGVLDNLSIIVDEVDVATLLETKTISDLSFVSKLDMNKLMNSSILSCSIANALVNKDTNFLSSFASYIAIPEKLNSVTASGWYGNDGELVTILNYLKNNASKIDLEALKNKDYSFIKDIDITGIKDSDLLSTSIVSALVNKDTNFLSSFASYIVVPDELNSVTASGWYGNDGELVTILNAINEIKNDIDFNNILTAQFIKDLAASTNSEPSKLSKLLDSKIVRCSVTNIINTYAKDYVTIPSEAYETVTVNEEEFKVITKDELLLVVDAALKLDVIYDTYKNGEITISEQEYNALTSEEQKDYKQTLTFTSDLFAVLDTLNQEDTQGYTKIDYIAGSNDNNVKGSKLLNATVVNLINKFATGVVIIPDDALVGNDDNMVSSAELRTLLTALTEVKLFKDAYKYNDTTISEADYNALTPEEQANYTKTKTFSFSLSMINELLEKSNSNQNKSKIQVFLGSDILSATVSKLLTDMSNLNGADTLIVPTYVTSSYNNGETYYQIDNAELKDLIDIVAKLQLVDEDGNLSLQVGKLLTALNTTYQYKEKEVINNVTIDNKSLIEYASENSVLHATISKFLLDMGSTITIPDAAKDTINTTTIIKSTELVNIVKAIDVLELMDSNGNMKNVGLNLINEMNVAVGNKTKLDYVLDSLVLDATISKLLLDMNDTIIIDSSLVTDGIIDETELRNLINVIIELEVVDTNGNMGNLGLGLISKLSGTVLDHFTDSTIMMATVSDVLCDNEALVIDDSLVTDGIIDETEFKNLINVINELEVIDNNGNMGNIGLGLMNKLTGTVLDDFIDSSIMMATVSDVICDNNALVIDATALSNNVIIETEFRAFIDAINTLQLVNGDTIADMNTKISEILNNTNNSGDKVCASIILRGTIGDKVNDAIAIPADGKAGNIVSSTELKNLFGSLKMLGVTDFDNVNTDASTLLGITNLIDLFDSVTVWDKISATILSNCGAGQTLKLVSNTDTIVNGSVTMNAYDTTITTRLAKAELVAIIDTIKSINSSATSFAISGDDIEALTSDSAKYTTFANEASKSVIMIYSVADLLADSINSAVSGSCLAAQASKVNTAFDKSYWLTTNNTNNGNQLVKVFAGINALKSLNTLADITEDQLRTIDASMVLRGLLDEQLSYYECTTACSFVGQSSSLVNYTVGDVIGYVEYGYATAQSKGSNFTAVTYDYEASDDVRSSFIDTYLAANGVN